MAVKAVVVVVAAARSGSKAAAVAAAVKAVGQATAVREVSGVGCHLDLSSKDSKANSSSSPRSSSQDMAGTVATAVLVPGVVDTFTCS